MTDRLLNLKEVSEIAGVSIRTLRRWLAENQCPIPFSRVGPRILRARESDVRDWLAKLQSSSDASEPNEPRPDGA